MSTNMGFLSWNGRLRLGTIGFPGYSIGSSPYDSILMIKFRFTKGHNLKLFGSVQPACVQVLSQHCFFEMTGVARTITGRFLNRRSRRWLTFLITCSDCTWPVTCSRPLFKSYLTPSSGTNISNSQPNRHDDSNWIEFPGKAINIICHKVNRMILAWLLLHDYYDQRTIKFYLETHLMNNTTIKICIHCSKVDEWSS